MKSPQKPNPHTRSRGAVVVPCVCVPAVAFVVLFYFTTADPINAHAWRDFPGSLPSLPAGTKNTTVCSTRCSVLLRVLVHSNGRRWRTRCPGHDAVLALFTHPSPRRGRVRIYPWRCVVRCQRMTLRDPVLSKFLPGWFCALTVADQSAINLCASSGLVVALALTSSRDASIAGRHSPEPNNRRNSPNIVTWSRRSKLLHTLFGQSPWELRVFRMV